MKVIDSYMSMCILDKREKIQHPHYHYLLKNAMHKARLFINKILLIL
jgi:hypothetical protein